MPPKKAHFTTYHSGLYSHCVVQNYVYEEGEKHGWPVAASRINKHGHLEVLEYKYTAYDRPPNYRNHLRWAIKIMLFYKNLPFYHNLPDPSHIVYDDPEDLRIRWPILATKLDDTSFVDGKPVERRDQNFILGLLLLNLSREIISKYGRRTVDLLYDYYQARKPLPASPEGEKMWPQLVRLAWDMRDCCKREKLLLNGDEIS